MQDPSDSPVMTDADLAPSAASTVVAEVLPGIAVVFGANPAELKFDLLDFGIVPAADRRQIATFLASIGNTSTLVGNVGNAVASAQGLYRLSESTRALLDAGGRLAAKDGANLGTVLVNGSFKQARLIRVDAVSMAQKAAAIGPALAMIALQLQLSEVSGIVRTNVALTGHVLRSVRNEQWAELMGLVASVNSAVDQAREIEAVPNSLWDNVAGSEAVLRKQLNLYRQNVQGHIGQIERSGSSHRREYLQTNAEAIAFDANALLSSLKAWTGYQALRAGKARTAGRDDPDEARLVEVIARDTGKELDAAIAEATELVDSLTRELRIIAELPGPSGLAQSLTGWLRDPKAGRETSARLLEAIQPLADALHPPVAEIEKPDIICAPTSLSLEPYLRILRWFLTDDETLRALGLPDQPETLDTLSAIVGGAKERLAGSARILIAVTNRRIVIAKAGAFLEQGDIRQAIPLDQVRYVRTATIQDGIGRSAVDLITRDENIRWIFPADIDNAQVAALAAVLAEAMMIPDDERAVLLSHRRTAIEPDDSREGAMD